MPPWGYLRPEFDHPPVEVRIAEDRFLVSRVGDSTELRELGIEPGDRVFGLMGRQPELYAAILGTLEAADIPALVRKRMAVIYPHLRDVRIDYAWGGTLAITMKRLPHLARVAPNVLSASGYSGHGVGNAVQAGKLLAEAVRGQSEGFDAFAALPTPRFPGGKLLRFPALVAAILVGVVAVVAFIQLSGGQSEAGLYFEIRRGTQPLNPRRWVTRRPGE